MKLSGQATVPHSIDPALSRLIAQQFPAAQSAGSFFPLSGLTGQTGKVELAGRTLLARRQLAASPIPGVSRRREYRILRRLAGSGLAPAVLGINPEWLLLTWLPGEMLYGNHVSARLPSLTDLVIRLHRQPLSGYRLEMLRLLEAYWLLSCPSRRHIGWLRALKACQARGEPKPLRLALLHMDIHAGNIIVDNGDLHLIDWEYASDGDVALELAAMIAGNGLGVAEQASLIEHYACTQRLDISRLHQQVRLWQPWLRLLMASWYELRWQQSGEAIFYALAAEAWQRVLSD
ncbi:thiamine kinase [Pantoea sp. FN060301]|uniref:thiamine kinase n=1 Tax=Pantoea sp. FN060301 TaxID=3420380 RepID=UPI003D180883